MAEVQAHSLRIAPMRLCVVNLEPVLTKVYRDFLSDLGHEVESASSVAELLELGYGNGRPLDVVFADLCLPGDLRLLENLRTCLPKANVVAMVGPGCGLSAQQAVDLNVYAILRKPFWLAEVELLLLRLAEARGVQDGEVIP